MKNKIEIGGEIHPLIFNMNSLRNIMTHMGMKSFVELQQEMDLAMTMDLSLVCAFYGILEAYEIEGKQSPFQNANQIGRKITKYTDLMPAMKGFSESLTDFFQSEEEEEKK